MALFVPSAQAAPNPAPRIIPALQGWEGTEGSFVLSPEARIAVDAGVREVGEQFATDLADVTGAELEVVEGAPLSGDFVLRLDPALVNAAGGERFAEEGYTLEATTTNLVITAPSTQGVFYGTRTALQGIVQTPGRGSFPAGETADWPDYEVRGFSLDVGRRFFSAEFIRDYITMMSWYKLNEFQIHLNDNEIFKPSGGWKDAYAGFRLKSENPEFAGLASVDGSYDRADWQSFEDAAASHAVRIIPEIDVPAHSLALINWKPELGLNSGIVGGVPSIQSDHLDLTPANRAHTTDVIKSVFDEFIPWFEGSDVHFGADEYPKEFADGYRTFFNDMAAHVRSHGKQPRAWGSMKWMHGSAEGYDHDVTVNAWSNDWYEMPAAVRDGYKFINTNDATLYVVPFANYYHGNGLPNQQLYNNWYPNRLVNSAPVEPGAPAGAMFAVWNDLVNAEYTELGVHGLVRDSFPVIAQKSWRADVPTLSYADFAAVRDQVGGGPGLTHINQEGANATPGELTTDATVTASGSDSGHPASALLDGLPYTRWQVAADDASFTIDLGARRAVGRVAVEWAQPLPTQFTVELSDDGTEWHTAAAAVAGTKSEVLLPDEAARYVRVSASGDGSVGAWSAKVFAPVPLSLGATVTASGQETADFPPQLAVDGDLTTRWSANSVAEPWIQLDMGAPKTFDHV
ncbi:MAG: family 20 glycosylhydrolase, partial [Arachnia sp.]